jgi:hypothetical protein
MDGVFMGPEGMVGVVLGERRLSAGPGRSPEPLLEKEVTTLVESFSGKNDMPLRQSIPNQCLCLDPQLG